MVLGYGLASVARPLVALAGTPGQVLAVRLVDRVGKGIRSSPRDALLAAAVTAVGLRLPATAVDGVRAPSRGEEGGAVGGLEAAERRRPKAQPRLPGRSG